MILLACSLVVSVLVSLSPLVAVHALCDDLRYRASDLAMAATAVHLRSRSWAATMTAAVTAMTTTVATVVDLGTVDRSGTTMVTVVMMVVTVDSPNNVSNCAMHWRRSMYVSHWCWSVHWRGTVMVAVATIDRHKAGRRGLQERGIIVGQDLVEGSQVGRKFMVRLWRNGGKSQQAA